MLQGAQQQDTTAQAASATYITLSLNEMAERMLKSSSTSMCQQTQTTDKIIKPLYVSENLYSKNYKSNVKNTQTFIQTLVCSGLSASQAHVCCVCPMA